MSGIGQVQSSGDGYFLVNGQKMDLGALMMMLQIDRTKALDIQIADQMKEIQARNTKLRALNDLLAQMRKLKEDGIGDEGAKFKLEGFEGERHVRDWVKYFGWDSQQANPDTSQSKKTRDGNWDTNIELIKGKIDGLNSESQLDMIRLQSMIDKRNQAFEMASNTLQKDQKTRDSIVGNFR